MPPSAAREILVPYHMVHGPSAVLSDRPREPGRRVAESGPQLEYLPGAEDSGQDVAELAGRGADDREVAYRRFALHCRKLAVARGDVDDGELLSLEEFATRSGVPASLIQAVEREGIKLGRTVDGEERLNDIVWLHPTGHPMEDGDWEDGSQVIGMYLNGDGIAGKGARGEDIHDDHFLLYFNADGPVDLTLPPEEYAAAWDVVINTGGDLATALAAGSTFRLEHRSLLVLQEHSEPEVVPDSSVAASVASATQGHA